MDAITLDAQRTRDQHRRGNDWHEAKDGGRGSCPPFPQHRSTWKTLRNAPRLWASVTKCITYAKLLCMGKGRHFQTRGRREQHPGAMAKTQPSNKPTRLVSGRRGPAGVAGLEARRTLAEKENAPQGCSAGRASPLRRIEGWHPPGLRGPTKQNSCRNLFMQSELPGDESEETGRVGCEHVNPPNRSTEPRGRPGRVPLLPRPFASPRARHGGRR